jgi:hypothetical protein
MIVSLSFDHARDLGLDDFSPERLGEIPTYECSYSDPE